MAEKLLNAELYSRGEGHCRGTIFSGETLGHTHSFRFADHNVRIRLPHVDFESGDDQPKGKNSKLVRFRSGRVDDKSPSVSYYSVEYLILEIEIPDIHKIPQSTLDANVVQIPNEKSTTTSKLDNISQYYQNLQYSTWRHWRKIARWSTNQYRIGLEDSQSNSYHELSFPRICEKNTDFEIWSFPAILKIIRSAKIDINSWSHIESVLRSELNPPLWFDYLVEAHMRLDRHDYTGCLISSVIACETLARTIFRKLAGTPTNAVAGELVDRLAAQAIIGKWKDLTGIKADGRVHQLFDQRNKLVHNGHQDSVDESTAASALKTAISFVDQGDIWWFNELNMPNPRIIF